MTRGRDIVPDMKSRRDSHTEATIAAILKAGRRRFGAQGFDAAGLEDIATDARVTTGAIYHHFAGKKGLFQAVAEQIEAELLTEALAAGDDDPWQTLHKAFAVLVDACAKPEVQRIIFLDAPRVIGPEAWREIELKYAYGGMSAGLTGLMAAGVVRPYAIELIAPVLTAVLAEASRAAAADPAHRDQAVELVDRILDALRAGPEPAP
jgi:AcrR family transcriptional regulator